MQLVTACDKTILQGVDLIRNVPSLLSLDSVLHVAQELEREWGQNISESPQKKIPTAASRHCTKASRRSQLSVLLMEDIHPGSTTSDDPLDISESLVPARKIKQAGQSYVSFDGLLQRPLLLKEDLKEGCGGQLWPAGMVLAKYMLRQHRFSLADKTMSVASTYH